MRRTSLLLTPLLLLFACGKDSPDPKPGGGDDSPVIHDSEALVVGAEGGEIELGEGATLEIPAGALAEDVEITATVITDLEGWAEAPSFTDGVRFAVSLEPHGLSFAEPATLRLPHGGWDDRLAVMRTDDPTDSTWEVVAGMEEQGDDASVLIDGFSGYALVTVKDGSCPCFDASDVVQFNRHGKALGWPSRLRSSGGGSYADHAFYYDYRVARLTQRLGRCDARTVHSLGGTEASELFDAFLPELTPDYEGAHSSFSVAYLIRGAASEEEERACSTLILAGARGELSVPLEIAVDGLGAGEATLTDAGVFVATLVDGSQDVGEFPPDGTIELGISGVTPGLACTFEASGAAEATIAVSDGAVSVSCAAAPPTTTTTTYEGPSASGVDTPTPTTVDLEVLDEGTVTDIDVQVELTDGGGYAREIELSLVHDGVTVIVHERVDNPSSPPFVAAVLDATFDDEAADPVPDPPADRGTGVTVDVVGTFQPDEPLEAFDGGDLAGTWTLSLVDVGVYPYDGETLASWSVVATSESTAAECPCWDASVFASAAFTECLAEDLVPYAAADGVDDYFTVSNSSAGHTVGTNNDPNDEFFFCKGWGPGVAQTYLTEGEHSACLDLVQGAIRDAGLSCP